MCLCVYSLFTRPILAKTRNRTQINSNSVYVFSAKFHFFLFNLLEYFVCHMGVRLQVIFARIYSSQTALCRQNLPNSVSPDPGTAWLGIFQVLYVSFTDCRLASWAVDKLKLFGEGCRSVVPKH